eukprot:CAMPEP_0115136514 /NCGR_PEP_ID=MMETSP0227-20121206/56425_1 /TAXON_ID=89957 /ORGANISM="Polarella glacialis, Strain CCMP 1383" /LENGTH=229 /DNA_ID=CAMNT_0002543575 /DNA_START=156 /DNA_END=842 /DNA_ORIENTATION=+
MASQVASSQFDEQGQGHQFQLRKPLAKPTAKRCLECGVDVFSHSRAEVSNSDLMTVIDVTSDDKASVIIDGQLLVGGFKAALAASKADASVQVLNCAGLKLHDFLPNTRGLFDELRSQGRVLDVEWEDSEVFADARLHGDEQEAEALEEMLAALLWARSHILGGKRVVINCAQGKSRSGTMATAYCMAEYNLDANAALDLLKQKRPFVHPNAGFLRQLKKWDLKIRGLW